MERYEAEVKDFNTVIAFRPDLSAEDFKIKIKVYTDYLQLFSDRKEVYVEDLGAKKLTHPTEKYKVGLYIMFTYQAKAEVDTNEIDKQLEGDEDVLLYGTAENPLAMLDDLNLTIKSEQPDALDVLLGFADYNNKKISL